MTGLSWIDIVLRLIPEALIIILAGYAVSKTKLDYKRYLLSSLILALVTYVFKILPISALLPTILSAIAAIVILVFINKIKAIYVIISTIACLLLSIFIEAINLYTLKLLTNTDTSILFKTATPILRILYALPSLLVFAAIVLIYYIIILKKNREKNVINE